MFKKSNNRSDNFSDRSTKSLHRSLAEAQHDSIVHRKAQAEIDYRRERNSNIWKVIGTILTITAIAVGIANYIKG